MRAQKDRISFDPPSGFRERLEELRVKSGCTTLTEVFRRAIAYYEFANKHEAQGAKICIEFEDGTKETIRFI